MHEQFLSNAMNTIILEDEVILLAFFHNFLSMKKASLYSSLAIITIPKSRRVFAAEALIVRWTGLSDVHGDQSCFERPSVRVLPFTSPGLGNMLVCLAAE